MVTASTPLVIEAVETYCYLRKPALAEASWPRQRNILLRFARFVPTKQVGRLTPQDVQQFYVALTTGDRKAGCRNGPVSKTHYHQMWLTVNAFLNYCQRSGWLKSYVADPSLKAKGATQIRRDFLRLSADQLLAMLDYAPCKRDRALLAMGMNTGLRVSEMLRLRLRDVDLDECEVYTVIPKTGQSDYMPITRELDAELRSWLTWYASEVQSQYGALRPDWFLFPSQTRPLFVARGQQVQRLIPHQQIAQVRANLIRAALVGIGIPPERTVREGFHTLRRSVARVYFDQLSEVHGYSHALRTVSALLHHSQSSTTERYLGLDVERRRRDATLKGQTLLTKTTQPGIVVVASES